MGDEVVCLESVESGHDYGRLSTTAKDITLGPPHYRLPPFSTTPPKDVQY
jgi:hypothetical protein